VILACRRIGKLIDGDEPVRWISPAGQKEGDLQSIVAELEEQLALQAAPAETSA
jgi:hypothetical protein